MEQLVYVRVRLVIPRSLQMMHSFVPFKLQRQDTEVDTSVRRQRERIPKIVYNTLRLGEVWVIDDDGGLER